MKRLIYGLLSICVGVLIAVGLYFLITTWVNKGMDLNPEKNNFYYKNHEMVEAIVDDINTFIARLDELKFREDLQNSKLPENSSIQYFFDNGNPDNPYEVNATKESISKMPFIENGTITVLLHGYNPQIYWEIHPLRKLVQVLIKKPLTNVFHVIYSNVCDAPFPEGLSIRGHLVAKEIAKFLDFLTKETGSEREQIHLVGYSLGGQVAGFTGKYLPGIGRITALDPADLVLRVLPEDLVLNKNDANFVQVIHSNAIQPFPKD